MPFCIETQLANVFSTKQVFGTNLSKFVTVKVFTVCNYNYLQINKYENHKACMKPIDISKLTAYLRIKLQKLSYFA